MNTKNRMIADIEFPITLPYEAGHTLNDHEAAMLNQLRIENISNQVRKKVQAIKDAKDENGNFNLQAALDLVAAADANYDMSQARVASTRTSVAPLEREIEKVAKDQLRAVISAKHGSAVSVAKYKEANPANYEDLMEQLRGNQKVIAIATERLRLLQEQAAALKAVAADVDVNIDLV